MRRALLALVALLPATPGAAQVVSGSYLGDGILNHAISGVGFRPDAVIVKSATGRRAVIRSSTIADVDCDGPGPGTTLCGTKQLTATATLRENRVLSLDADGFSLGTDLDVNGAGTTYHWIALKAVAGLLRVGSYLGDGSDDRSITGVGFQPDYVITLPEGAAAAHQRSSAMAGDVSYDFQNPGSVIDHLQALQADGFQVGTSLAVNESGVRIHYLAWKAAAGRMAVGSYTGNGLDDRSIAVGFRPEWVVEKRAVASCVLPEPTSCAAAVHKSSATGVNTDATLHFTNLANEADNLEALEANGFQVGANARVNSAAADTHYWMAFGSGGNCCSPLGVAEAVTTVTVTGLSNFELRFNKATGGAVDQFFDLQEDPARSFDLAGGAANTEAFPNAVIRSAGIWHGTTQNENGAKLDVLEVTATRVRLRQEAFYEQEEGAALLAGVKGFGDFSVYPAGRMAWSWTQKSTAAVPYTEADINLSVNNQAAGPLSAWVPYSQTDGTFNNPGNDDFTLLQNDSLGVRTDFLNIMYRDWVAGASPYHLETAEVVFHLVEATTQFRRHLEWREQTGATIPAASTEKWHFLVHFKPTTFIDHLDTAVTGRSNDYRTPDPLSLLIGNPWIDASENTAAGDDFNEAEGAYVLTLDPSLGLQFDMDGSIASPRFQPFFKVRQWRSLAGPPSVTVAGTPLVAGVDYRADVKPMARAHFAQDLLWHSTLQDGAAVTTPDAGSAGAVVGGAFAAARFGSGFQVTATGEYVSFPIASNFDPAKGALEFWYQPTYASGDGVDHPLAGFRSGPLDEFLLQKDAAGNLVFLIMAASAVSQLTVAPADYSWRANDWVHIRVQWDDAEPLATQQRLFLNGSEPAHTDPAADYVGANLDVSALDFLIGRQRTTGVLFGPGLYDEVHVYGGSASAPDAIAHGGLRADASEFLADPSRNFSLSFALVDAMGRGEHAYFGSDSQFHGLNVAITGAGTGLDLLWEYWNGTAWTSLESGFGLVDTTANLTKSGNVYWTGDPAGWAPYSVNGGPDLYFVRASLVAGSYSAPPAEALIKTDILLFQYCAEVTAPGVRFSFAPPVPTAVRLQSLSAIPGDTSVSLEWRTASELDNLGFHVYRALSGEGPWTRLTASLIPGLGSSALGQAYAFRDTGLVSGTRYFYRLDDVDAAAKTTSHGPVSAVPQAGAPAAVGTRGGTGGSGKQKAVAASSCPGWVLSAYASAAGSDTATGSLRCTRHGDPEAVSLAVLSRDARQATLELRTGGFYALHEPAGGVRVYVPGFDFPRDESAAALPIRRALVDAVVGRRVQLGGVRALELLGFRSLLPSPLGRAEMQVGRDGTLRAARRASARTPGRFAASELVTLLPSVFQGETKSAVVEIAPLRFDERRRVLVLARRVRLKLLFAGREAGESGRGSHGRAPGAKKPTLPIASEILARLYTTSRGLCSASFEQLFPGRRRAMAFSELRLERQGEAVAFHLEPAADSFGPGGRLFFFADKTAASTDFSAETAWELVRSRNGLQMSLRSAAPGSNGVLTPSHVTRVFETDRFYQPGLLEAPELWLWDGLASGATRTKSFSLSGIDSAASGSAELDVDLQGASESGQAIDHHVSVSVNGVLVGEVQFAGKKPHRVSLSFAASLLRDGTNELQLASVPDTGVSSYVFLDRFSLTHPQRSTLTSGLFEGTWSETGAVSVSGLTAGPVLVDTTHSSGSAATGAARWLTGWDISGGSLRFQAEAGRSYLVVSAEALLTPRVAAPEPSSLRSTTNQADYILVAPRAFLAAAQPLIERRSDQGLTARAVAFEEIASEFGHGQASAETIKAFLAYAFHSWSRPSPRYLLLLGDSSYDPRNFTATSQPSPLPALWAKTSYLWTVSDPLLAAVNGEDGLPDLAIGRLPATTLAQAEALVAKLMAWEDSGQGLGAAAALVADNPDLAGDFEADVHDIAQSFLAARNPELLLLSQLGPQTRPRIQAALNSGLSFLSYVGHGGAAVWASENVWNSWDAASLQAQSEQPLLLTLNCLNGYFVAPAFDSLAESLLKAEGRGAIASFSPSGLSLDGPAHQYHRALMAELTRGAHQRLGDALLTAQKAYAATGLMPELISVYHLLGDPATRIR